MDIRIDSKSPRAGRSESFPSGTMTYLSPLPLPTGLPPVDHSQIVAEMHEEYLELGAFAPNVFSWQATIGAPMVILLLMTAVLPTLMFLAGLTIGDG